MKKVYTVKQLQAAAELRFPGTTVKKVDGAYQVAIANFKTFNFDTRQEMLEYMNYWFNK